MRATDRFAALMNRPEVEVPLDTACLLIAAHAHTDDAVDRVVAEGHAALDGIATGCARPSLEGLCDHLFGQLGFTGNRRRYEDPRNSYLDVVIARRTGLPITLAIVVIETARRVGLRLVPVGMPGHFLVGVGDGRYLDAFHQGRILDQDGCRRRLAEVGVGVPWTEDLLDPIGAHAVLARVLANLRRLFADSQDLVSLDWVLELRASIPGVPQRERAERAAVLAALGRYDEAASQLEYLARAEEELTHHPSATSTAATDLRHQAMRLRAKLN
ncbi:MAG: SirB1 family protein [Acidimicrobiales bacterium]